MYLCEVWYCCVTLLTGYLRQLLWRLLRHFLCFALTHDRLGLSFSAASSLIFSTTCWTDFCETWMEDGSGIGICGPALSWLESYLSKEHYASLIIILHQCLPVWSIEFPRALFLAHALLFLFLFLFHHFHKLFTVILLLCRWYSAVCTYTSRWSFSNDTAFLVYGEENRCQEQFLLTHIYNFWIKLRRWSLSPLDSSPFWHQTCWLYCCL